MDYSKSKFQNAIAEKLYGMNVDEDFGSVQDIGWNGLISTNHHDGLDNRTFWIEETDIGFVNIVDEYECGEAPESFRDAQADYYNDLLSEDEEYV